MKLLTLIVFCFLLFHCNSDILESLSEAQYQTLASSAFWSSKPKMSQIETRYEKMKKAGVADIHDQDINGKTALMLAIQHIDDVAIIEYLIGKGADVNAKDTLDRTPLMYAFSYQKKPDIPFYLKSQGASLYQKDQEGCTPVNYCINSAYPAILSVCMESFDIGEYCS